MYDLLIKNAHLVDKSENINQIGSVAVRNGKIEKVCMQNSVYDSETIIDARGLYLSAGLIDLHCHPVAELCDLGAEADRVGIECGVSTLCDGGSAGCDTFMAMEKLVIDKSITEIFSFLNIARTGLVKIPEISHISDINIEKTKKIIASKPDRIKGVKVRVVESLEKTVGIEAVKIAKEIAVKFGLPLMMHIGESRKRKPSDTMDSFSRNAVSYLEEGDILSHYLTWEAGGLIFENGQVDRALELAIDRGVALDSCHGLNHFSSKIAKIAIDKGILPTIISTDMSAPSAAVVQSLAVVMSKFLNMGLSIDDIINMTSYNPAKLLKIDNTSGSLKIGKAANMFIFSIEDGNYCFKDGNSGETVTGEKLIEPRMTILRGKTYPAYSNYHL